MTTKNLAAPNIPVALEDGLISLIDSQTDIHVELEAWAHAHSGDTYQLVLNQYPTGPILYLPDPVPPAGTVLTFKIAKEALLSDGVYQVAYQATNVIGGTSAISAATPIRIDRTPPGATLLAPMIFPTASFGDQLIGLVPGYAGMEPGDLIQTLCNGTEGPAHRVQADELTLRPIEVAFEREFLQGLNTDSVLIEYQVTDRAGNPSVTSLPVLMTVNL
jgi:hypothetical protein